MINHFAIFSMEEKENNNRFVDLQSLEDKNKEQSDINYRNIMSIEADEETFESAAENDNDSTMDDEMESLDDEMDAMDSSDSDDFGDDFGNDDGDSDDGENDKDGINDIDKNRGSSLNPFTQVNQKLLLIGELNELSDSIQHTISEYNNAYADWSELNQLRELKKMLDGERNAFIIQQNPENLIKLRLYNKQYETIVKKLSNMISDKAKRNVKQSQSDKNQPVSKN